MKIKEVINYLNTLAPSEYQESYDNTGLLVGSSDDELKGILITLDCTEEVVHEALRRQCNFIVAHHPVIFKPLKRINRSTYIERAIITAIKNDVNIFSIHTNLDNVLHGVNGKIADLLELEHQRILIPKAGHLLKLIFFVPKDYSQKVKESIFDAGGGHIGNYTHCSFSSEGKGTFMPSEKANPYVGKVGQEEIVEEERIEVIFPLERKMNIIKALMEAHPYEVPAYDIVSLSNEYIQAGSGVIGELKTPKSPESFLQFLKERMKLTLIRHTGLIKKEIRKVAVCGGSGSFLLQGAIQQNADIFISSDFKYHEFFDAEEKIIIADINHYEGEVFTKELIYDYLRKKFTNIALVLSEVKTNPISLF